MGISPKDLGGGGAFRWLARGLVFGSLLVVLALVFLLEVNVIVAALVGFSVLILGLVLLWVLVARGYITIKL